MRRIQLILILILALRCGCGLAQSDEERFERMFLEAGQHFQNGDYENAAAIYRQLLELVDTPRIRLELARTLYYQKQYKESKALFKRVSNMPGLPWEVQDNIDYFVRDIEAIAGYARFSASVVTDSNPRNISQQREFTIGGVPLTYVPPEDAKRVTGVRYGFQGAKPLFDEFNLATYLSAAFLDFPGYALDRLTLNAGLIKSLPDVRSVHLKGKLGIEYGAFAHRQLYEMPYVGLLPLFHQSEAGRIAGELKIGWVRFSDYSYLNGTIVTATLAASKPVSMTTSIGLEGSVEESRAAEKSYSYRGASIGPSVTCFFPGTAFLTKAGYSIGTRRYQDMDPFFGEIRDDVRQRLDFTITNKRWRWRSLNPEIALSAERTSSSIAFFDYEKTGVSLVLQ